MTGFDKYFEERMKDPEFAAKYSEFKGEIDRIDEAMRSLIEESYKRISELDERVKELEGVLANVHDRLLIPGHSNLMMLRAEIQKVIRSK